ncbi:K02A2.6-like [Cordylochernes scorpioides]|uniref:RNA-directed DNA polymerase n=1 Tax=Cordylochernes scorpioides TaxID=51811 RepID=A0ABY6KXI8_9ARAC|nr:K02A2.6-like [Cordylochernes scorpioides]
MWKTGHIKPACKNRKTKYAKIQHGSKATRKINVVEASENGKYFITLNVDNKNVQFEFDTGSCHTLMPINLYKKLWNKKIFPINLHLKSYSNTKIDVIGKREVFVAEANKTLPLIITEANRPVLLGTTWIKCLPAKFLKFSDINLVQETCSSLVNKFAEVFGTSNVGVIKDHKAHLILRKDANPRFFRARNVPYVMRNAIEKELENLEAQGVITKIERSDWATPIVPIMKKNGHVRICGDFKITLNPVLKIDQYPLPKIEDIFAILGRGINFSKIDLSQAYLQLELDENSKEMAVINTHKGLYRYNRLPFGIASAPAIWQRIIEQILSGIPGTLVYLDDILITGESEADHLRNLEAVLNRLNNYGLKANREKCNFFQESLEYCGHVIDKMGLHKTNDKIRAVLDAPKPLNVTQLRAFLGLVTYYHKFIRNAADVLSPLYALLKKGTKWHWSTECRKAFREIKEIISSDQILIAYDPKLPIRLSCDSSSYGLGAVLSQIDVDGNERPIYFISRTLSQAEKKYSQIDKECLSIIWALKKFNNYLFGRKFELITDNKPLHHILNPKREISSNMSARLQRWALILSSYNFTIECRKTGDHGNADGLSRLPLEQCEEMEEDAVNTVHMIKQCEELPLTSSHIRRESCKDSILKIVYQNTLYGWKDKPSNTELLSFYLRREELTVEQGILLLGTRVVIPRKFRAKIKAELHQGHLGVVKMKALARNFIWWPGIDREIEEITRVCRECNINNHTLKQESVHRWESAPTPWYRIHLDFAGPFMNRMFLIVIDSYSKWPEVIIMNSTTTGNTIRVLRDLFSRYGIPDQVVTDNGPQFVSEEMKYFFKSNGVHHLRSAPYFPATNGLAERFVQTLKRGLKNMRNEELNKSLANFLFTYRTVPHSSTREAPVVLFLKRMLKCKWNLLKPKVEVKPGFKKGYSPDFEEDEDILVRDFLGPNKWKEGKIVRRLGKCFYTVKLNDGRLWRRHVCQLRKSYIAPSPASEIFLPEQLINYPRNESRAEDGSVEIPVSPSKENIPSSPGIPAPEEPGPAASDQDRTPQRRPTNNFGCMTGERLPTREEVEVTTDLQVWAVTDNGSRVRRPSTPHHGTPPGRRNTQGVKLHGFGDASEDAYAAAVYIRIPTDDGVSVRLLASKTKLAPMRKMSIPRLELCAALLLTRLVKYIMEELSIKMESATCWSDSTIILSWLRTMSGNLPTFISNRVAEIQSCPQVREWRCVPTGDNPADIASRGILGSELKQSSIWWTGPTWLSAESTEWPRMPPVFEHQSQTELLSIHAISETPFLVAIGEMSSTFNGYIRKVAWILRYCHNCRYIAERYQSHLTPAELRNAHRRILQAIQYQHFREEIRSLTTLGSVRRTSKICGLTPFLDDQGILGVSGRLKWAPSTTYERKHPALLPSSGKVAQMIVQAVHMRTMHGSVHLMLSTLRQKYWMLRAKDQMKRCIRECVTCCRYNRVTQGQLMSDLPKERLTPGKPFSISGVDHAGPVNLRLSKGRGRKTERGYICLFVCFVTRAVHLELVTDASTPTFMSAFKRFVARRGHCTRLYNDQGVVTPAHFLLAEPSSCVPEDDLLLVENHLLTRWQLVQKVMQHLWKRWSKDYLNGLQQRNKWKTISPNVDINMLVLIKEERMPPARWLMGRVVETHPGKDGLVRVVSVRTSVGVLRRPLVKLVLLPVAPPELDVTHQLGEECWSLF